MPEIQKALKVVFEDGNFSTTKLMPIFKRGYGYCNTFGCWLEDNGIVGKRDKSKSRKLRVKSYEEVVGKLKLFGGDTHGE